MRAKAVSGPVLFALFVFAAVPACSRNTRTYDDIERRGAVESTVRSEYGSFFDAVRELAEAGTKGTIDSTVIRRTASRTDRVVTDARYFPKTVQSRLALDALSYAARDLAQSPGFTSAGVSDYWERALIQPLIFVGNEFARRGDGNPATRMQLVKAIARGVGDKATTGTFLQILPIFGTEPDSVLMRFADADSLMFKRIHDLVLYGRSLQPVPPPSWMLTGSWFLAVDIPGSFPVFVGLVPVVDGLETYLSACFFEPGEVYERVYRDPAPTDGKGKEEWIARADAAMKAIAFDDARADSVRTSGLETFNAHYFLNDYLLYTEVNSARKEFIISLKRPKIAQDGGWFIGGDDIRVIFTLPQIKKRTDKVTVLTATRVQRESVLPDRHVVAKSGNGRAFLMPLGEHSDAVLRKLAEDSMPEISVGTK